MEKTDNESQQQLFCEWHDHWVYRESMSNYLRTGAFSDLTIQVKDGTLKSHKIILSACSSYFEDLLISNKSSVISFPDITKDELKPLLDYLYVGSVVLKKKQLEPFLKLAQRFQVRGITEKRKKLPGISDHITRKCSTSTSPAISSDDSPVQSISSALPLNKKRNRKKTDIYDFHSDDSTSDFELPRGSKKLSKTPSKNSKDVIKGFEPVQESFQQSHLRITGVKSLATPSSIDVMSDHAIVID